MEYNITTLTISRDEDILRAIEIAFDLGFELGIKPFDNKFEAHCDVVYDLKGMLTKKISDYLKER